MPVYFFNDQYFNSQARDAEKRNQNEDYSHFISLRATKKDETE